MSEVFDSEFIKVEYRKDENIVLVVLKGKVNRDDFRTPMMHAADMVMRYSCKSMTVDFRADPGISENDAIWSKKVLLANLKKSGLENLVLIDSEGLEIVKKTAVFCEGKFNTVIQNNMNKKSEDAEASEKSSEDSGSTEDRFASMTREQALEYMGLDADADIKVIDDRFWQMSKHYRGKDDPESVKMEDEISAVYEIASGRRDRRLKEEARRVSEPKYFGRYKSDWKNIIHYNWKNFVFGIVIAIAAIAVIIGVATNVRSDCTVVVFGHMRLDDTYMRKALIADGIKSPYIGIADLVVPNDQDVPAQDYGSETFNAMFYMDPDVMISDKESYCYYFSTFKDLSPLYDRIMDGLTDEAKAGVIPVYMTEQQAVDYNNRLMLENGVLDADLSDPSEFSDTPVLIGIEIVDEDICAKLGIESKWMSGKTSLVFGQCSNSTNDDQTVQVITVLINAAFAG